MKKAIAFLSIVLMLLTSGCVASQEKPQNGELFVMSTYVTQQVYGKNKKQAVEQVHTLLKELENQLSLFIDGSDIDNINKNAGISYVKVNDYTFDLIRTAKDYSEKSQGLFDVTIAPLTLIWGIDTENAHIPQQSEIDAILNLVDYTKISLDNKNKAVKLEQQGMALDLGGIAKGYIVNRIQQEYEKLDIRSALVSIGGNIFAYGTKPDGSLFKLGIRNPNNSAETELLGKISLENKVVATTGAYERFFEQDGKIYHHILDVNTGYPVDSDILSVTVICEDGGLADYLSTTLFIAGKEHISTYLNDARFHVIVVTDDNMVYLSNAIKDEFELTDNSYTLAL